MKFSLPPHLFWCCCFIRYLRPHVEKLDARIIKIVFLGYSPTKKSYKHFDLFPKKWYVTSDVAFLEDQAYFFKNPPQEEIYDNEEYSQQQEIKFTEFLEYYWFNCERHSRNGEERDTQIHLAEDNLAGLNGRHDGKVYMRWNCRCNSNSIELQTDHETNPNPSSDSIPTSPDDPSIDDTEDSVSSISETSEGEVSTYGGQGTSYPLERYVSYSKITKN